MRLRRALQEKLLDVRLRDKLIAEGKISNEEVEKYLKDLPDDQDNMVYADLTTKKSGQAAPDPSSSL